MRLGLIAVNIAKLPELLRKPAQVKANVSWLRLRPLRYRLE
jgi:hypothetical protein